MNELIQPYHCSLLGLLALAVLMAIQFLVADVAFIRARHTPGMPVTSGHGDFFFRATRAYGNTQESLGLFLLAVLVCMLGGANAHWSGIWVWLFVASRAAHMAFYYANLGLARSASFGIGGIATLALLVNGALALL